MLPLPIETMPRWRNGRRARFRCECLTACRFESYPGHKVVELSKFGGLLFCWRVVGYCVALCESVAWYHVSKLSSPRRTLTVALRPPPAHHFTIALLTGCRLRGYKEFIARPSVCAIWYPRDCFAVRVLSWATIFIIPPNLPLKREALVRAKILYDNY